LQSAKGPIRSLKLVSSVVLALALVLALLSRDVLLVLAVTTAIAGLILLNREQPAQLQRRAMLVVTPARPAPTQQLRGMLARSRHARRMAVPRFRSASIRSTQRRSGRSPDVAVTDSPANMPVIQVLQ
jgi:hypothetical protein